MRHGEPPRDIGAGAGLGPVGLEEFQPCRGRREQIADFDMRACWLGARDRAVLLALVDADLEGVRRSFRAGGDLERRDRADRRQRLAAKAERGDGGQIAVRQFRSRMALDGEVEVLAAHAQAVIDDADQLFAARLDGDVDPARAGVERVLDQLLQRRGRPPDDLAGGDAIDEHRIETANGHGLAFTSLRRARD